MRMNTQNGEREFLDMVERSDISLARDISQHSESKPFSGGIVIGDRIHLIDLFKRGVEGYVGNTRETLQFLCKSYHHRVKTELAERVQYRNGKTMILLEESTQIFDNGDYDRAFIFNLDANRVEVFEKRPIPVSTEGSQ